MVVVGEETLVKAEVVAGKVWGKNRGSSEDSGITTKDSPDEAARGNKNQNVSKS